MIFFIRRDDRTHPAVLHAQSPNIHALAAHPHAAVAENAARPVEKHHRRPLLLVFMILRLHEFRFRGAVRERHVLQFALAARIAHRTIQRMVPQQHLQHRLPRLLDLCAIRSDDHAFADHGRTRSLQLRHLLDLHQAHPASALQRQVGVIAKRRHFNAHGLAGLNQQRPRGSRDLLAVNCKCYVSHNKLSIYFYCTRPKAFRTDITAKNSPTETNKMRCPSCIGTEGFPHSRISKERYLGPVSPCQIIMRPRTAQPRRLRTPSIDCEYVGALLPAFQSAITIDSWIAPSFSYGHGLPSR